jgi:hypothetical protein
MPTHRRHGLARLERKRPPAQLALQGAIGATQQGRSPHPQQLGIERLDEVVIGASLEAEQLVGSSIMGGEHQHQRLMARQPAQLSA